MAAYDGILGAINTRKALYVGLAQDGSSVDNTAGGGATVMHTITLAAGGLAVDGDSIEFFYAGTWLAGAANRLQVVFGSTTIFDIGPSAVGLGSPWVIRGRILRTGAATQQVHADMLVFGNLNLNFTAAAETLSSALALTLNGYGTAAGDVRKEMAIVDFRGTAP
jgi:hypothetical protein